MNTPKTIFCDIDGTLLEHKQCIVKNYQEVSTVLPNVQETIKQWNKNNYYIVLTTGRQECLRSITEKQLLDSGIIYDKLIMGLPTGERVLINDKKIDGVKNTAFAINVVRNEGFMNIDLTSKHITIPDRFLYDRVEKPWGYEELIECNDKYVVKKLFMKKGHACSTQYHKLKTESILVYSGVLNISIGSELQTRPYQPGETITILPYTIHKMEAVEDCTYYETSTNELWDVVRISDNYGRK